MQCKMDKFASDTQAQTITIYFCIFICDWTHTEAAYELLNRILSEVLLSFATFRQENSKKAIF